MCIFKPFCHQTISKYKNLDKKYHLIIKTLSYVFFKTRFYYNNK